ncbi:SMP-30/gluconolactonase/LRE family protein [Algirhabdus cladophorae]|uniref:SMP-30/gluconolactonase/LRE family protein n=1 Tax=Algirhabdus cladophorae TaxID=3377108 RepID=UPI003B84A7A5
MIFDDRVCALGEGAFWHPDRSEFFWFDILNKTLHSKAKSWAFDHMVSACGWIDRDTLLIASDRALFCFDLTKGTQTHVANLEADNPNTRSNDGRADPWGGFWISTMGLTAQPNAGSIYRFYKGELNQLFTNITIPNAICFAPDKSCAYFSDSGAKIVWRQPLDDLGWPQGDRQVFLNFTDQDFGPDGAVTDANGTFWNAQWGAGRVAAYDPKGQFIHAVALPALHTSCPAFGGPDLTDLYVTSATQNLSDQDLANTPEHGQTFVVNAVSTGLPEPRILLD